MSQLFAQGKPTRVSYDLDLRAWRLSRGTRIIFLEEPKGDFDSFELLTRDILGTTPLLPGAVVLEVGAGLGTETLTIAADVGDTGLVVAIEAHPRTASLLEGTLRANALTNVRLIKAAATSFEGVISMTDEPMEMTQANRIGRGPMQVEATTLDQVTAGLGLRRIDLLKMNIEGAEWEALRGAPATLGLTQQIIVGCHDFLAEELDDDSLRTMDAVHSLLRRHGFDVRQRNDPRPWASGYLYGSKAEQSR